MREIFFQTEEIRILISDLKKQKVYIENILDEYQYRIVNHLDKLKDFEEKIKLIKNDLVRVEDKIIILSQKLEKISDLYERVEEENLKVVENLPYGNKIFEDEDNDLEAPGASVKVVSRFDFIHDNGTYRINRNYDFDDWLIEWLNSRKSINS